tara:strand:+ start:104 stop:376 length:273 start_codon:yes stop_codon:yes gene_type:complete
MDITFTPQHQVYFDIYSKDGKIEISKEIKTLMAYCIDRYNIGYDEYVECYNVEDWQKLLDMEGGSVDAVLDNLYADNAPAPQGESRAEYY